jgi:hypothetical protein
MSRSFRYFCATLLLSGMCASAQAAQLANYDFDDSLSDSLGGAPDLVDLGAGSFLTETVLDNECRVFDFAEQTGLSLDISGFPELNEYTFVIVFRFENTEGWSKILDLADRAEDYGLYAEDMDLVYYNYDDNDAQYLADDTWALAVFTRDIFGHIAGYVDGAESFALFDSGNIADVDTDTLFFFRDDFITGDDENSAGRVANIQIYDRAISADDVIGLQFGCGGVTGFPEDRVSEPVPMDDPISLVVLVLLLGMSGVVILLRRGEA